MKYQLSLLILLCVLNYKANCSTQMQCLTQCAECLNDICQSCIDSTLKLESNCLCEENQYNAGSDSVADCKSCHKDCMTCQGPDQNQCITCKPGLTGWGLNRLSNTCECMHGYAASGDSKEPCKQCYKYGSECVIKCPTGYLKDDKYMTCTQQAENDVENSDDTLYILAFILLIILIISAAVFLFHFFSKVFKKIFQAQQKQQLPLTDEEKMYLAQQQEDERMLQEHQAALAREEEMIQKQKEEEARRRRAEEEERQRLAREAELDAERQIEEERRRKQEEEEEARRVEEQALRQIEEQKEKDRLAEEERLRAEAEEAERVRQEEEAARERKRLEDEEAARQAKEEEERLAAEKKAEQERLEAEKIQKEKEDALEKERLEKLELARQAREKRKLDRQLTKQKTMQANDAKVAALRAKKEQMQKELQQMEEENKATNQQSESITSQFGSLADKMEKSRLRKQQTIQVKQSILQRQATIADTKKKLEGELEGIDFSAALNAVKNIKQEDVVFMQQLKTPPERIRLCLEACIMLLTGNPKPMQWGDIKKEISDINFRKNMLTFDPESMSDKIYKKILKEYTGNAQWNLQKIVKASPVAGTFAVWMESCMKYKKIKVDNKELFDQVKEMQMQEKELSKDLDKLDELENDEKNADKEQDSLNQQGEDYKKKQETLKKQSTIQQSNIEEKQNALKGLNTGDLDLEAIEESEEESDLDSDIDLDALNNKA